MRVLLGWALVLSLAVSPAMARANGADDSAAPAGTNSSSSGKPAAAADNNAAKPAASSTESEIEELRDLMESQARQLQEQNEQLKLQQQKMAALEEQLKLSSAREALAPSAPATAAVPATLSASAAVPAAAGSSSAAPAPAPTPAALPQGVPDSPLQFHLGSAFFTPLGFMDFTGVGRTTNAGNGIGSNFGSIPYPFTSAAGNVNLIDHATEARLSMQNSRFGMRIDAMVKGAHVIGYTEWDFLGNNAGSVAVTSNSNTFRSRLYWVDVTKGKFELLAGQTWSLITPGRSGISPLPGNIFYSNDIDVNYQTGLVWGRIPEIRFVYHPTTKFAWAIALDNQEQYVGGSGGGGLIILPSGTTGVNGGVNGSASGSTSLLGTQLNNANTTVSGPQLFPDIIMKLAFDPTSKIHVEAGGVERQFKVAVNSGTGTTPDATPSVLHELTGGGAFVNSNIEVFKGFHLIQNYFYSIAGGRYIFGLIPDVTVNPNGSLTGIVAQSTVDGFEETIHNTLIYGYYGAAWAGRNVGSINGAQYGYGVTATGTGSSYSGALSQNRDIEEATIGFNQTIWRDAKYGALNFMGQYSHQWRAPWSVAPGQPTHATLDIAFINLRYTLPGAAPAAAELR